MAPGAPFHSSALARCVVALSPPIGGVSKFQANIVTSKRTTVSYVSCGTHPAAWPRRKPICPEGCPAMGAGSREPSWVGLRNLGGNAQRSRHALNADTIREMHLAFRRGGRKAIEKVMRTQPAVFLKLLVLLVPREMKMEHSGGVKAMTDEQIEAAIEAIQGMLAQREAGAEAKVINELAQPAALPAPSRKPRRKRRAEATASPLLLDE